MMAPPLDISRDYSATREALAATLAIFFRGSRTFWHQICDGRGTVPKLRNIVYMHVGPKMAPKCDFVYKINANWVFSLSSYKYAYFYSQLLKLISFWFIVLQKVSATNFGEKNNKNKGKKTKKYIRNSQNNKIHKKLILIPEFFQVQLLRMLQRVFRPKICTFGAIFTDLEQKVWFLA